MIRRWSIRIRISPFVCVPDANGYFTSDPTAPNYYEWCGDHNKALESTPSGRWPPADR